MYTGLFHTHVTVVLLFLLLYTVKVFLLVTNKTAALDSLRAKTKVADMILGTLILGTGIFLAIKAPSISTAYIVKFVLVILSIPMGIVALKKSNKPLAILVFVMFVYIYGVAETKSLTFTHEQITVGADITDEVEKGKTLYQTLCVACHGADGKLRLNGAKDLSATTMTEEEMTQIIKKGKNGMTGFGGQLNDSQIKAIITYVATLKN